MSEKTIFPSPLTSYTTDKREELGSIRWEGKKAYKYVKIDNDTATVAGAAGDPVAYAISTHARVTAASSTGYAENICVIDLTDADSVPICAGFLTGTVTGTADTTYYGWIQIKGVVVVPVQTAGSPSIGNPLTLTTTDKTLTKGVEVDSAGAYKTVVGILLTTSAANNKIIADCPY